MGFVGITMVDAAVQAGGKVNWDLSCYDPQTQERRIAADFIITLGSIESGFDAYGYWERYRAEGPNTSLDGT